ncbi:MAG: carbohydrate ABC transporter permease, partial [Bacillota bacterium]|nr:carbohydrate ABC transporter permease [Bacillota bacterium]
MSKTVRAPKERQAPEGVAKFNRVSMPANIIFSVIFILAALCCVIPLIFVIIISFSDQSSINSIGYSFTPLQW